MLLFSSLSPAVTLAIFLFYESVEKEGKTRKSQRFYSFDFLTETFVWEPEK
jgi:hypothetical protein